MTKDTFINLCKAYETVLNNSTAFSQVGVDLFESKLRIMPYVDEMLLLVLNEEYTEEGVDLVKWFIHDNKMGRRGLTARDPDGIEICQTIDELYNYIEENCNLYTTYES